MEKTNKLKMSENKDYSHWFTQNPKLAFPMGLISYGDHVDENGNTYTSAAFLNGESFKIYGTQEERNEKYSQIGLSLMGIGTDGAKK